MDKPSLIELSVKLAETRKAIKEAEERARLEVGQLAEKSLAMQEDLREGSRATWQGITDRTPTVVIEISSGHRAVLTRTDADVFVIYEEGKVKRYGDVSRCWVERNFVFVAKLDEVFLYTMDRKYGIKP